MPLKKGRNINSNDVAYISDPIELSKDISTVIAVANPDRIFFHVTNSDSKKAAWVKLQPAIVDNEKKGIFLNKKDKPELSWTMPSDNIYTGEISAIADADDSTLHVTEY